MGRFDALTKLEEQPSEKTPLAEVSTKPQKKTPSQPKQNPDSDVKKPEIMKSRNHENESSTDLPVKYSTLMRTHFIKRIKIHATETELKDYEVIELALTEFFKKH
jgi:chromatin segregation and condensation protein Rec8/ScpA/Scc1 (kleisin family)